MPGLARQIQVNLPFRLIESLGPVFLERGLSPEIGLDAQVLDETPGERFEYWAERFKKTEVTIHAPFMDLAPGGIDPLIVDVTRKRLLQAAELVEVFGAESLIGHAYYDLTRYPVNVERWVKVSLETWRLVLEASEVNGCQVLVENVYERDPEALAMLLTELKHPRFGFCLDTGHFNAWSVVSLDRWLNRIGSKIKRLHLHDNDGSFDQHLGLGQGNFDFRTLFDWLRARGLNPGLTLEPHREEDFWVSFEVLSGLLDGPRRA